MSCRAEPDSLGLILNSAMATAASDQQWRPLDRKTMTIPSAPLSRTHGWFTPRLVEGRSLTLRFRRAVTSLRSWILFGDAHGLGYFIHLFLNCVFLNKREFPLRFLLIETKEVSSYKERKKRKTMLTPSP